MSFNLRKRPRVSYYEPDDPSFDEYIYCDQCMDFVYEHCAIHGPLLVIPDDKVPLKTNLPSYVPQAALTIPHVFLHLAPSIIPGAGLGVFSTLTLPRGVRFGPYCGQRTKEVDSMYCWQVYDRNNKRDHVIDAADTDQSNWMRYVNCARHWKEQNLLAYQYKGQLYYRTIKIIPRFTELMVFYGSEYANALHINLAKYYSAEYYKSTISTQLIPLVANKENLEQDHIAEDQLHIDEDKDQIEDSKHPNCTANEEITEPTEINDKTKEIGNGKTNPNSKYECETCNKSFLQARYLKRHKNIHLNTWRFNCEKCDYKTNFPYYLKRHLEQHTIDTKKYSCEKCNFQTIYKRSLKRHSDLHKGIVPKVKNNSYKYRFPAPKACSICDFSTISRSTYNTHVSKHSGIIYQCNDCSYSNHIKYNLARHIRKQHQK